MEPTNIHILLIEDNPGDAKLFEICLEESGIDNHQINFAGSLNQAMKVLEEKDYDIVITDLGLPDSSGIDTFKTISSAFPKLPVIVLTGHDDESVGLEAVREGAQDFITKNQVGEHSSRSLLSKAIRYAIERKKAEEKLQQLNLELEQRVQERTAELEKSQQLYSTIATHFPNGTINVLDTQLKYVLTEGKELHKQNLSSEELIGTSYIKRIGKEMAELAEHELRAVFKGESKTFEIRLNNESYELNAVPLPDQDGSIHQILVVELNITQQKKAEEEILNSLKKERELNDMKTRFVAMASHEFRTPLSTVLSSITLVEKYTTVEQEEKKQKHIGRIKSSVKNLTGILDEFLSLGKLETGSLDLTIVEFDLVEFCEEIADAMQGEAKTGQEISLTYEGNGKIVKLDQSILRNILTNLLSNAIKYSPENKPIDFVIHKTSNQLTISITDKGIGIPEEDQPYMFGHFFRATNVTNIQGTGLGLNIVKKYVEMLGGTIDFTSTQNEGTTFTVAFPQ